MTQFVWFRLQLPSVRRALTHFANGFCSCSAWRRWMALALAASLAACAAYASLVEPGTVEVQGKATVVVPAKWNKLGSAAGASTGELWVREGVTLDSLRFMIGLKAGEPVIKLGFGASEQTKERLLVRSNMTPEQIVELLGLLVRGGGPGQFKATKVEPATVLGQSGVRVEFSTVSGGSEVEYLGVAYGTSGPKELSLMVFQAAKVHYFPSLVADAEAIMKSAKLKSR